jgi:hypothetical protein
MIDRDDHDPLELVAVAERERRVWRAISHGWAEGHWLDGKPRTAAEATWRAIVGQP